jgi:hypothetical protein
MKKLIKNYTTDVPVERTIAEIQELLRKGGAKAVAVEYNDDGVLKDIFFKVGVKGKDLSFRLPAKPAKVYQAMWGDRQSWEYQRYGEKWKQQAERIAWRICKTWLEAQLTLITLEQARVEEILLPYLVMPNNKTLFEAMEERGFLLPSGTPQDRD